MPILGAKTEGEDDDGAGSECREARAGKQRTERPKEARRGDDEEAAGGRVTGKTEWAEDEAGEREREIRGEAVKSQSLSLLPPLMLTLESIVSGGGVSLSSFTEVAAGTARCWERREEERAVEEQPEAALTRSSGGEERRLATLSRSGSLARKKAALDQDESGNGPRRGWRSRGAGCTERDRSSLYRRG